MRCVQDEHKLACELFLMIYSECSERSTAILDLFLKMKDSGHAEVLKDLNQIGRRFSGKGVNRDIEKYMNQYLGEVADQKVFFHAEEAWFVIEQNNKESSV